MSAFIGDTEYGELFILDDAEPFGISIPKAYVGLLKERNKVKIMRAEELAEDLFVLAGNEDKITAVGSGGVIVYTLLRRLGYDADPSLVRMKRKYMKGELDGYEIEGGNATGVLVDDVIGSGGTLAYLSQFYGLESPSAYCLVLSGRLGGIYREKDGSTVKNIGSVCASREVKRGDGGFPAIFSSRFLLKRVREDYDYRKYLSRYVSDISRVAGLINDIDLSPFELLEKEPQQFIKEYGG